MIYLERTVNTPRRGIGDAALQTLHRRRGRRTYR